MFRLSAPFGEALLEIEMGSAAVTADRPVCVHPVLPGGMRVDSCQLHSFSFGCDADELFTVALLMELREGWTSDYSSGEALDAFEVRHPTIGVAAVGMRDPDWLCDRFALVVVESTKVFRAGKPVADLRSLTARYKASRAGQLTIQVSLAWTNNPTTDQEAISPWFAVDKAMTF